jgi:cell wall assembly regulator SMI1
MAQFGQSRNRSKIRSGDRAVSHAMEQELRSELEELDGLLAHQPFATRRLRPPAAANAIDATCERLGLRVPPSIRVLYAWRDGTDRGPGDWPLYLFPPFWEFLRLERLEDEAPWAIRWCREAGVHGVPFALEATGQFLVAESSAEDRLLRVSSDHVVAAWPDGTMRGLISATSRALSGHHREYVASFTDEKMAWLDADDEGGGND